MQIEVAASSSPFSYVSLRDQKRPANTMGYINSQCVRNNKDDDQDSSWLPSQNSKTDDSWLPVISHNSTVTSVAKGSSNRIAENNVDDSWLPTVDDSNGKHGTHMNESENDIDYSWLPSTFVENNKNKQKNDTINKNVTTKIKTKNTTTNTNTNMNKSSSIKSSSNSNSNSNSNNSNSDTQNKSRNDHWALARKVVFSSDQQNQNQNQNVANIRKTTSDSTHLKQQDSPSSTRYVVESPTSGGVSSLLQRWKDLAEVNNSKNSEKSPTSSPVEESDANLGSDANHSRRLSCPLPSRDSKDSNPGGAEKEKIRVVDIIKKLSREEELAASHASGHGNQALPPIRTTIRHKHIEGEHKGVKNIKVSRHLIRGRQAYEKFLMQMERDKHHELKWLLERKSVSKFSHRGRIKALLRFKFLRLGTEPKQESKIHTRNLSKPTESNNRLDIIDLRERFNSRSEKATPESKKNKRNDRNNTTNDESPTTSTSSTATKEVDTKTKTKPTINNKKQEPQPKPEPITPTQPTQHSTTSKDVVHKATFVDSFSSPIAHKEDQHYKDDNKYDVYDDEGQFMSAKASNSGDKDRGMQSFESFHDWMTSSEYSQTRSDLDEDESYDMQLFDTEYDWISDISRPKKDWEDMRQARKSVSGFLGSSMRDLIDQLMMSRMQQSHAQVEKQDGEDCRSSRAETKCSEYSEYADQRSYSERLWRPNDIVCNSETTTTTTTSPSIERSLSSTRSQNNSTPQSSPAITHQTIEMELIYDLRGHMEQLHGEIMELRKSIKSCVNMQVKLQHSFKQNIAADATHSVQKKEKRSTGPNCSICYEMQVDALLYRCGHMCTCFKCALELQRTGEECPVCEAPIVDVVKAI
ncbi:hypothetical protein QVD17_37448 [Tagetes erecta]|uniref:RING-type domain-containing protein n=1 Tax=Tagetes erecta TaxID=13708 RepID=A0AAD8JY96_TARER|nr:hypothetical protein QVD17_37448 [Tagetes erecta]